jgi:hypothetical protein
MSILTAFRRLASAATVFFGGHGAVSQLARQRAVSRQSLYREADGILHEVEGTATQRRLEECTDRLQQSERRLAELEQRLAQAVLVDEDKQAHFASRAQAEGVSLPVARRLLAVLLEEHTPSVAQLGRFTQEAARRATALLAVIDPASRPLVHQAAGDEIFAGHKPILMVVEQESLCWTNGRLAEHRDGPTWAEELRQLPALEQLTRDAGSGMAKGLEQVNGERRRRGAPPIADQSDHFHLVREGARAVRRLQGQAARALERAEQAQKELDRCARQGRARTGRATVAGKRWRAAEAALDRWSAQEQAWQRVRTVLPLFTPDGAVTTRARAEAVVAEVLPQLTGEEWAKVRRLLGRPEVFTYVDRVQDQLAQLPVAAELRQAALDGEGLRRHPERLQGEGPAAGAARGVALLAGVVLALAGAAGQQAVVAVRGVLRQAWRASSLVEGLNSVLRMQQARHRRLSQGLLDLKRLYWNCRELRTGKRKKQTPYGRLGLSLPTGKWWDLLKIPPEQLRQQLSAPRVAA